METPKAVRIQIDLADGSKLVAEGEEAGIVWSQIESACIMDAIHTFRQKAYDPTAKLHKILPDGIEDA